MELQSPYIEELSAQVAAAGAGADSVTIIGRVPFDATVEEVVYVPNGNIVGANVDTRSLAVVNKGSDGNGAVSVASLAFANGVNANDFQAKTVTKSGVAANLEVSDGDVLAFTSTHAGNGIADPGGRVIVTLSRRYE